MILLLSNLPLNFYHSVFSLEWRSETTDALCPHFIVQLQEMLPLSWAGFQAASMMQNGIWQVLYKVLCYK